MKHAVSMPGILHISASSISLRACRKKSNEGGSMPTEKKGRKKKAKEITGRESPTKNRWTSFFSPGTTTNHSWIWTKQHSGSLRTQRERPCPGQRTWVTDGIPRLWLLGKQMFKREARDEAEQPHGSDSKTDKPPVNCPQQWGCQPSREKNGLPASMQPFRTVWHRGISRWKSLWQIGNHCDLLTLGLQTAVKVARQV